MRLTRGRIAVLSTLLVLALLAAVRSAPSAPPLPIRVWTRTGVRPALLCTGPDGPPVAGWRPAPAAMVEIDGLQSAEAEPSRLGGLLRSLGFRLAGPRATLWLRSRQREWEEWVVVSGPWPEAATPDAALSGRWIPRYADERGSALLERRDASFDLGLDGTGEDGAGDAITWARAGDAIVLRYDGRRRSQSAAASDMRPLEELLATYDEAFLLNGDTLTSARGVEFER